MILLLFILIAAAWAFYATLLAERPDLAVTLIPTQYETLINTTFAIILLAAVLKFSWREIRTSSGNSLKIYLRNLVVISLGIALLIFTTHEILNGLDPTGRRRLFG